MSLSDLEAALSDIKSYRDRVKDPGAASAFTYTLLALRSLRDGLLAQTERLDILERASRASAGSSPRSEAEILAAGSAWRPLSGERVSQRRQRDDAWHPDLRQHERPASGVDRGRRGGGDSRLCGGGREAGCGSGRPWNAHPRRATYGASSASRAASRGTPNGTPALLGSGLMPAHCSSCGCERKYHVRHPSINRRPCNAFRPRELEPGEVDFCGLYVDPKGRTWRPCHCPDYQCAPKRKDRAAVSLGRRGGKSTSPAKVAAARANGRKGGRPKKSPKAASRK